MFINQCYNLWKMIRTTKITNPKTGQTKNMIRIDTTLKITNEDNTVTSSPIIVHIDVTSLTPKQQMFAYKVTSHIFDKEHTIVRHKLKSTPIKKPWWKFW